MDDSIRIPPERVICQVTIPGEPRTKLRVARRADGRAYSPKPTTEKEAEIGWTIKAACPGIEPNATHDLGVRLRFATTTRQRRDLDNLVKLVLDACNRIVWADDLQIVELGAGVLRGDPEPRTELTVYTVGDSRAVTCGSCGVEFLPRQDGKARGKRFCSKTCYDEAQRLGAYVYCWSCQTRIYRQNEKLRAYDHHYCSDACKAAAKNEQKVCRHCRVPFSVYRSAARGRSFCSPACNVAFHRARGIDGTVKVSRQRETFCPDCGGPKSRPDVARCRACFVARRAGVAA